MKVTFLSIEDNLTAIGFRRMAAVARSIHPDVEVGYVVPSRTVAPLRRITGAAAGSFGDDDVDAVASHAARSDMVCLSSMTTHAPYVKRIVREVRRKNPRAFVVWGGVHCILDPEDAIQHADAVCTGEGERAFEELLRAFRAGRDYTGIGNFHFATARGILRNGFLPLQTPAEMERRPFPLFGQGELFYRRGRGFVPLRPTDYVRFEGLTYNALWSIGCPNRCVYCGNSRFLRNDRRYAELRHPSVDYIVGEVGLARERAPHLSSVTFHDDNFMALPVETVAEFSSRWRREVRLPFAVHGLMPRFVDADRMRMLVAAGMMRVRMGIQSGSASTLRFYRRPASVDAIRRATRTIHAFSRFMVTPSYDLIVENPGERKADVAATLRLLREIPRPYVLNLFPLMVMPGTELADIARRERWNLPAIAPPALSPSIANVLVMAMAFARIPERWVETMLERGDAAGGWPRLLALLGRALSALSVLRRALAHLRRGNLSVVPGRIAWLLWKAGVVRFLNGRILRRCASVRAAPGEAARPGAVSPAESP